MPAPERRTTEAELPEADLAAGLLDHATAARLLAAFEPDPTDPRFALLDTDGRPFAGRSAWSADVIAATVRLARGRTLDAVRVDNVGLRALPVGHPAPVAVLAWDATEDERVTRLAEALTATLERLATVREEADEEIAALQQANLFYLLGETIGSSLDADRIVRLLLIETRRIALADAAAMVTGASGRDPARVTHVSHGDEAIGAALTRSIAERLAQEGVATDWRHLTGTASGLGPILAVPVRGRDVNLGNIILARRRGAPQFTARDERVVAALAAGAAIERARYHERELQRLRQEQELAMGRRIQLSLLPRSLPEPPGWSLHAKYRAAREVGGDFYTAFMLPGDDRQLLLMIGDVTGKGVPAALMMAHARTVLCTGAAGGDPPTEVLESANRLITGENRSGLFLTAQLGSVDLVDGTVRLASAGHEPAVLVRASGDVVQVGGGGLLLGMRVTPRIFEAQLRLKPGDTLVLITDGVTDARDTAGTLFGEERLMVSLAQAAGRSAREVSEGVTAAVDRFRGAAPDYDDLTLLVLRREP